MGALRKPLGEPRRQCDRTCLALLFGWLAATVPSALAGTPDSGSPQTVASNGELPKAIIAAGAILLGVWLEHLYLRWMVDSMHIRVELVRARLENAYSPLWQRMSYLVGATTQGRAVLRVARQGGTVGEASDLMGDETTIRVIQQYAHLLSAQVRSRIEALRSSLDQARSGSPAASAMVANDLLRLATSVLEDYQALTTQLSEMTRGPLRPRLWELGIALLLVFGLLFALAVMATVLAGYLGYGFS